MMVRKKNRRKKRIKGKIEDDSREMKNVPRCKKSFSIFLMYTVE
jgi:hypothetical protein